MRERVLKKKNRRGRGVRYFFCIAGLVLAVTASFWAPRAVFAVQDYYQAGRVALGARDVLELARFDLEYEQDLEARLQNFAEQLAEGREFYAVATDFKQDEMTVEEICDRLIENKLWYEVSFELTSGCVYMGFKGDAELLTCRKYVIFDGDFDAGIALSCLYVELYSESYGRVRALLDLADNTIYYYEAEVNADVMRSWGYSRHDMPYERNYNRWEVPYAVAYNYGQYYHGDFYYYYDEMISTDSMAVEMDRLEYCQNYSTQYWQDNSFLLKENHVFYSMEVLFDQENLHVVLELEHDEGDYDFVRAVLGIREIGGLIPEFNRD